MIALLAAYTKTERVIGAQGKIPWKLNSERRRFKEICNGKKVIMGKKSFEEIGHALPYCTIVIISKSLKKEEIPAGCELGQIDTTGGKLKIILQNGEILQDNLLIAGGEQIYRQTLEFADTVFATEVDVRLEGDRFFPPLDESWKEEDRIQITDDFLPYEYVTYKKVILRTAGQQ